MKKKILFLTLFCSIFAAGAVAAGSLNGDYKGMPIVKVNVDGKEIQPEVPAHILDGSTMLPLRAVSEALGAEVTWDPSQYMATVKMPKPGASGLSLEQLNKIGESVGMIYELNERGEYLGQGTGFLLANGVFVTCDHVVNKATSLRIDLNGKSYTNNGQYLFRDATADLAAMQLDASNSLTFTTELPKYGDQVYSLGFPHGKFQINEGVVVSTTASKNEILSTAKTEPGNSGGILINASGQVVGVTSNGAKAFDGVNYSGAIHMSLVQQELDKLK